VYPVQGCFWGTFWIGKLFPFSDIYFQVQITSKQLEPVKNNSHELIKEIRIENFCCFNNYFQLTIFRLNQPWIIGVQFCAIKISKINNWSEFLRQSRPIEKKSNWIWDFSSVLYVTQCKTSLFCRVERWYIFAPKNSIWVFFGRPWDGNVWCMTGQFAFLLTFWYTYDHLLFLW
jgi:hypothetical protein